MEEDSVPVVAGTHFTALKAFLASYTSKDQASLNTQRQSAREKLTRLTGNQFLELSTDVYDEMNRRLKNSGESKCLQCDDLSCKSPFLPLRASFHQKRNQARQKLATLSANRFRDLTSDVYFELERRYPPLKNAPAAATVPTTDATDATLEGSMSSLKINDSISKAPPKKSMTDSKNGDLKDVFGMVNFTSLDNLMADLGSMIADSPESTSNPTSAAIRETESSKPSLDRVPPPKPQTSQDPELEKLIQSLSDELQKAKKDLNDRDSELKSVHDELEALYTEMERIRTNHQIAVSERDNHKKEIERHRTENEQQVRTFKQEIKRLQSEIDSRNPDTYLKQISELERELEQRDTEVEKLQETITALKDHNRNLENEVESHKTTINSLKNDVSTLSTKMDKIRLQNEQLDSENRSIQKETSKLQDSLSNAQKESAKLRETIQTLSTAQNSQPSREEEILNLNDPSYFDFNGLVSISDVISLKYAVNELIEASAMKTPTSILMGMKSIVLATRNVSESIEKFEIDIRNNPSASHPVPPGIDIDMMSRLRMELSARLPELMTISKNRATGADLQSSNRDSLEVAAKGILVVTERLLQLAKMKLIPSLAREADHSTATAQDQQSSNKAITSKPSHQEPDGSPDLQDTTPRQANDTGDLEEVKVFLENQTDSIVQNIQTLLQNMKLSNFGAEFQNTIKGITSVVDNLIGVSRNSLSTTSALASYQERGADILAKLSENNTKLGDLGHQAIQPGEKPSKQKLAAAAYEVAKFTKELVSLFDSTTN